MKKITIISIIAFIHSFNSNAQIRVSENFESVEQNGIPENWTTHGFYLYTSYVTNYYDGCNDSNAVVTNLFNEDEDPLMLITPNYTQFTNESKTVSYQLRIFEFNSFEPVNYNFGNLIFSYSTDNGETWIPLGTVNNSNYIPSIDCETITYTIPASDISTAGNLKFRWDSTYSGEGDYEIIIDNFEVEEPIGAAAAIQELDKSNLNIYPNPASNLLHIDYILPISHLKVVDMLGRNVKELNNSTSINITDLSAGTYLLTIKAEDNSQSTIKFVKK